MINGKFIVIGSNSFSGASFIAHLLKSKFEVIGISRSVEPNDVFLPYKWSAHKKFKFFQYDINYDLDKIITLIEAFQPSYLVNFAAQSMVPQSWQRPEDWFRTNTLSMIQLHNRLKDYKFLKKYVHVSTPEVYGSTAGFVKEDSPYNPSTPYAVSKAACDMSLMTFHRTYEFPVALTRAANVCGPGQQLFRIIPKTILCILEGQKLRLEGGGRSVRSFIHIRDVAEATLRVARHGKHGGIYHISTDELILIHDLVMKICDHMNVSFENHVNVVDARPGEDSAYLLDCSKTKNDLGWEPEYSLDDIIIETIDWIKKNIGIIRKQPTEYIHKP